LQIVRQLIAEGLTDEDIAKRIEREPRTVQRYKRILRERGIL
jgi:DNA-binding NarL/FixJ family response regulator